MAGARRAGVGCGWRVRGGSGSDTGAVRGARSGAAGISGLAAVGKPGRLSDAAPGVGRGVGRIGGVSGGGDTASDLVAALSRPTEAGGDGRTPPERESRTGSGMASGRLRRSEY